jgi:hypothetical protein
MPGTKYLYFCSRGVDRALILDRLIAGYLNRENAAGLETCVFSSAAMYTRHLALMRDRARVLHVLPEELEQCPLQCGVSPTEQSMERTERVIGSSE